LTLATAAFTPAARVSAATPTVSVLADPGLGCVVKGQGWPPGATVYLSALTDGVTAEWVGTVTAGPATLLVPCGSGTCTIANPNAGTFTHKRVVQCPPHNEVARARAWDDNAEFKIVPLEALGEATWTSLSCLS
jgi:hypothetical protein